jgi:hypothetical protein
MMADRRSPAIVAARRLCRALEDHGIAGSVSAGFGLAVVLVRLDLVVWCECAATGWRFRWWTGDVSDTDSRWLWTVCPSGAAQTAARRIADRCRTSAHSRNVTEMGRA